MTFLTYLVYTDRAGQSALDVETGGAANVSGGIVGGATVIAASSLNISGGSFGHTSFGNSVGADAGSTLNVSGGSFGNSFRAFGTTTLHGGDFRINGVPVAGLDTIGNTAPLTLPTGAVFTGIFSDGTPFAFTSLDSDAFGTGMVTLRAAALPAITPSTIHASAGPVPLGIRAGQTLVVDAGAAVGKNFNAGPGSTVRVAGGTVGENLEVVGGTLDINAGAIGRRLNAFTGATVNLNGGTVDTLFLAAADATVNVSGGAIGSSFRALDGTIVNQFGGDIGPSFNLGAGSVANIYGGATGPAVQILDGATINLFGLEFEGPPELAGLDVGETITVTSRNYRLQGLLADGSPFEYELFTRRGTPDDFFSTLATLTVTLLASPLGDYDQNGVVDAADYTMWQDSLGQSVTSGSGADGNRNGLIDHADYALWKANFGTATPPRAASSARLSSPQASTPTSVPEPATAALLAAINSLGIACRRQPLRESIDKADRRASFTRNRRPRPEFLTPRRAAAVTINHAVAGDGASSSFAPHEK